jgi:aryl-alcohol dehydrogenase-like predicted oxidoreductase
MRPIDRREFLVKAAASAAFVVAARARRALAQEGGVAAPAAAKVPAAAGALELRELGATGRKLPRLGLSCAPLAQVKQDDKAIAVVKRALELGIRYFDVAPDDEESRAETILGKALQGVKRDELWITTKIDARKAAAAKKALAASLGRLQTDYVDAVLIPAVLDREAASDSDSILDELKRAQTAKTVRWFGIHSNKSSTYAKRAMDRFPYQVAMVPINPTDPERSQFITTFLPFAADKKIVVVANQIFPTGRGVVANAVSRKDCMTYALAQTRVDVVAPACGSVEALEEAYAATLAFTQPTSDWLRELEKKAKPTAPDDPPDKDDEPKPKKNG